MGKESEKLKEENMFWKGTIVIFCILCVGSCALFWQPNLNPNVNETTFDTLKLGLSKVDVGLKLGEPTKISGGVLVRIDSFTESKYYSAIQEKPNSASSDLLHIYLGKNQESIRILFRSDLVQAYEYRVADHPVIYKGPIAKNSPSLYGGSIDKSALSADLEERKRILKKRQQDKDRIRGNQEPTEEIVLNTGVSSDAPPTPLPKLNKKETTIKTPNPFQSEPSLNLSQEVTEEPNQMEESASTEKEMLPSEDDSLNKQNKESELIKTANKMLETGQINNACKYIHADVIASNSVNSMHWSAILNRPFVMLRWAFWAQEKSPPPIPGSMAERIQADGKERWRTTVGRPMVSILEDRCNKGDFGQWLKKAPMTVETEETASNQSIQTLGRLIVINSPNLEKTIKIAKQGNVDILIAFAISTKPGKVIRGVSTPETSCQFKIYDVEQNQLIWQSKLTTSPIDAVQNVSPALLEEFTSFLDEKFHLSGLFSIQVDQDKIKEKIQNLSKEKTENLIKTLAELKFYINKKLITESELKESYIKLTNEEIASSLLSDSEETRTKAVLSIISD